MNSRESKTIQSFGDEWLRFDQYHLSPKEIKIIYNSYFHILPHGCMGPESIVADVGAGSGRFAEINANMCKELIAFEPSDAVNLCRMRLSSYSNTKVVQSTIQDIPSHYSNMFDFVYCIGVLHHTTSIRLSLEKVASLVKPGGYLLLYIYYDFDNRSPLFKSFWIISNIIRLLVSRLPKQVKYVIADIFAALLYLPLAKLSLFAEGLGFNVSSIPLSTYRRYSFKTMRTDSLDRFGTRIEHRLSQSQIQFELARIGFDNIIFSDKVPFWVVCALKK